MKIFTIGFTKKSAETFFMRLKTAGVKRLVDVRLNNVSQLAGFTKKDDLRYFTKAICDIEYLPLPELAPTAEILDPYKKAKNGDWQLYERQFLDLMRQCHIENTPREILEGGCLLCSEEKPHHRHRRLVAEYLKDHWVDVEIEHIRSDPPRRDRATPAQRYNAMVTERRAHFRLYVDGATWTRCTVCR